MNLEDIMQSEIIQSQKDKRYMIYVEEVLRVIKIIKAESIKVVARAWGEGKWVYCLMGIEFQFYKMKRVMGMDGGDGCTTA